jgi:CheY-like chemotaxis protein
VASNHGLLLILTPLGVSTLPVIFGHSEQQANVVSTSSGLLSGVLWPGILLYTLFLFEPQLRMLLDHFGKGDISVKAAGFDIQLKTAAVALSAASAKAPDEEITADRAVGVLSSAVPDEISLQRLAKAKVLWVDDRPEGNHFERSAMQQLGIAVDISTSTEDALKRLNVDSYDLIISDMGRSPDSRAGYTPLDSIRKRGDQTPFLIYASSRSPEHVAEAVRHGAIGCTNRPSELVTLTTKTILGRP